MKVLNQQNDAHVSFGDKHLKDNIGNFNPQESFDCKETCSIDSLDFDEYTKAERNIELKIDAVNKTVKHESKLQNRRNIKNCVFV